MLPGDSRAHLSLRPRAVTTTYHSQVASQVLRDLSRTQPPPSAHHQTSSSRASQLHRTELLQYCLKPPGNRMELLQYRLKSPGKPDGTLVISLETTWKDGWNSCIIAWNHLENQLELLQYWLKPPGKPDGTLALWLNHLENGMELLQYSLKPDETLVISLETIWKTGWKSCNIAWNRVDNIPNWRGMSFN